MILAFSGCIALHITRFIMSLSVIMPRGLLSSTMMTQPIWYLFMSIAIFCTVSSNLAVLTFSTIIFLSFCDMLTTNPFKSLLITHLNLVNCYSLLEVKKHIRCPIFRKKRQAVIVYSPFLLWPFFAPLITNQASRSSTDNSLG